MQHGCRRGRGRVRFRRPGVEREKRDKNSEADKQQQINVALRFCCDLARGCRGL